jgi:hypothetical protein
LTYDSDEDKRGLGGEELINLDNSAQEPNRDRSSTAADRIPKLNKP